MAHYWQLSKDGKTIVVELGDGTKSVIATVKNKRACVQMLRYAQTGEDVEALVDKLVGDITQPTT